MPFQAESYPIFAFDEGRFGLKSWQRRRWCPLGHRPPVPVNDRYQWLWIYVAVNPITGACFVLFQDCVNSDGMQIFLNEFSKQYENQHSDLLMDNAPSHRSSELVFPSGVTPIYLPPYTPELNPAECIFKVIRQKLANCVFEELEDLEQALTAIFNQWWEDPTELKSLTHFKWWGIS